MNNFINNQQRNNLFHDSIYSKLIDLTYKKTIIDSYNTAIKRDLYQEFYDEFIRLIFEVKQQNDYEFYIDYIQRNNYIESEFILFVENGGSIENKYQFLKKNNLATLERLNIKTTPNYQELTIIYQQKASTNEISENLNDDFLKVFVACCGKINLYTLTELFLDIIIDFKEFDGVLYIEDLIFIDKTDLNPLFYKKNGFLLYHKALTCYSYLDTTVNRNLIIEKMYACMDEDYDTNNNPIHYPFSTKEFPYFYYDGQNIGVIQKKDRFPIENEEIKNTPKWSFSNHKQLENAYRLNLISKEIYERKINILKNKEIDGALIISNFDFLELQDDRDILPQSNQKEYFHKPSTHLFDELNKDQKSEYITAFSKEGNVHKIIKYGRFRIKRLANAYFDNINLKDKVILELQLIKQLTHLKREVDIEIENINTHHTLQNSDLPEKFKKANEIISSSFYTENKGICVKHNDKCYRFYIKLELYEASLLPIEIIDSILLGGNITEQEYQNWEYEYRNTDVSYKASTLNEKIRKGEYDGLTSTRKKDAPLLINLLEKEYYNFMTYFKENLRKNQWSQFIEPVISRLMSAYITLNEYEKAIAVANEFIEIKNTYTELFLTTETEAILIKRENCLLKIPSSYLPYKEAAEFVKELNLKNQEEWKLYKNSANRPRNIPSNPEDIYKNRGWKGFQDWLGYDANKLKYNFLSYNEAREIVHQFKLTSENEWRTFKNNGLKPENIPAKPENVYKNKGWKGFQDWLGYETNTSKYNFLPYNEAKVFVHSLELESEDEWRAFKKLGIKPENIPSSPEKVYKDKGWKGFKDWLGY